MSKHAKTFNANKGFKIVNCCFYSNFAVLKIQTCSILFKHYLHKNENPA